MLARLRSLRGDGGAPPLVGPIRGELFGAERLAEHARAIARAQRLVDEPSRLTLGPGPLLSRLAAMETQIADLCGHLPTVLEKLDCLRELLTGRRKENFVVEEVAELTGRSEYTIRRWITEGKLKAVRISEGGPRGRLLIPRGELDKLVARGRGAAIPAVALNQEGV